MQKKLLIADYNVIVFETFKHSEEDFYKYYLNVVNEYYSTNADIIQELKIAVDRWLQWFKEQIYRNYTPIFAVDEAGNKTLINHEDTWSHDLFTEFKIPRRIYKSFLAKQLDVIDTLQKSIEFKNEMIQSEASYPESIKEFLDRTPFPDGFDLEDLAKRHELTKQAVKQYEKDQASFIAREMARLSDQAKVADEARKVEKERDYSTLIDGENYSCTLADFVEDSTIQKMNSSKAEYLKFLRSEKKRYVNSRNYYLKWNDSTIGDEHSKIADFISAEIDTGLSHQSKPIHSPGFGALKELFINEKDYDIAIKALVMVKAIDKKSQNLIGGKLKGVLQVWINLLRNDRQMIRAVSDQKLTELLNKYFVGLNLSEKTEGKHFRNLNITASKLYRPRLLAIIR